MKKIKFAELRETYYGFNGGININECLRKEYSKKFGDNITDKEIASFLYTKKEMYPNITLECKERFNYLMNLLMSQNLNENEAKIYLTKNKTLLLSTIKDIEKRLAIFNYCGINIESLMNAPRYLYNLTNEIIFTAIKFLKKNNFPINLCSIQATIESKSFDSFYKNELDKTKDEINKISNEYNEKKKEFLSEFENKDIAETLFYNYSKYPTAKNTYKNTFEYLEKILLVKGKTKEEANSYIMANKCLLLKTPKDLSDRISIFAFAGITIEELLSRPIYLMDHSDEEYYKTVIGMLKNNERTILENIKYNVHIGKYLNEAYEYSGNIIYSRKLK